jgi:short-subunit dehydrogenase
MDQVAAKIKTDFKVDTRTIAFDFRTLNNIEGVQKMNGLLDSIQEDICIIVNNVGKAYSNPFHLHPYNMIFQLLHVNMCSQLFLSHYFIPKFL